MIVKLAKNYWKSHKGMVILLASILITEIGLTVYIPHWRQSFYGAIEQKNIIIVHQQIWTFIFLIGSIVFIQSVKQWVRALIGLELRKTLTSSLLHQWSRHIFSEKEVNFPEQRINVDAHLATVQALQVFTELLISSFIVGYLIYTVTNGVLVLYAVVYSLAIIGLSMFFKKPMVTADINLQVAEAEQRKSLTLGHHEGLRHAFSSISTSYKRYLRLSMGYSLFSGLQNGLSILVPFAVLIPMYISGTISFGELMGNVGSFELIVINATIILSMYTQTISMLASWERVKQFYEE